MNIVKPRGLKVGDTIGVFSPSEPVTPDNRYNMMLEGIQTLQKLGFQVKLSKNALKSKNYMSGTPYERVSDLHELVVDGAVNGIMCAWGGKSTNHIIDLIDYALVKANPKIIIGFSDPTNVLNAIHAQTGLVTFYGPQNLGYLRNVGRTIESFLATTMYGSATELGSTAEISVIRDGEATGRLIGGNLSCFDLGLLGTSYEPDFTNTILFWETGTYIPRLVDQYLNHYRLCGVFDKICGMVIGYLGESQETKLWRHSELAEIVLLATRGTNFPILHLNSFGHNMGDRENITIPIGCLAHLSTKDKSLRLIETPIEFA